ncbi:phosphotyrosine-specific ptp2-like protein, partial [Coemansia aciculifera]
EVITVTTPYESDDGGIRKRRKSSPEPPSLRATSDKSYNSFATTPPTNVPLMKPPPLPQSSPAAAPPPVPPKDAHFPVVEGAAAASPFMKLPAPAAFSNRSSSPAAMAPPTPTASSIAQRRLQRKPVGLQLDVAAGSGVVSSPLGSSTPLPPPPATPAAGTWKQRAMPGLLGEFPYPPSTPAAIPDAQQQQNLGRRQQLHQHESSSRRLPPPLSSPARSASGDDGGQSSLKAFQDAVNASSVASSFSLRPTLLGASSPPSSLKQQQQAKRGQATTKQQRQQQQQQRVSGLNYIGAANLAAKLGEKPDIRGVVIDMRKSADYLSSHITSAIGMTVPTTLVKRHNISVQRLLTMSHAHESEKQQLAHWKQAPWITIYSEGSHDDTASEGALLVLLAKKFIAEAPDTCCVYVLEGGFAEFSRQFPLLCELNGRGNPGDSNELPVGGGNLALPSMKATPAQSSKLTVDLDHPMLRKMRQTPGGGGGCDGGNDSNEVLSMRMPPEFAALKSLSTDTMRAGHGG